MQELIHQLILNLQQTSVLEYVAVFFGIASVSLAVRGHIYLFPTGIINTLLYIYLSFLAQLYAIAFVNVYYTAMSIYGWYNWHHKKGDDDTPITYLKPQQYVWLALFFLSAWGILFYFLHHFAPSALTLGDSFASASAYTAMFLMTKKKLENWYFWIITNIVSIYLYFIQNYIFTAIQFIVFLLLGIMGLIQWTKKIKSSKTDF